MLVELDVVVQRYRAVLEVLDGASVTEVARRYGVVRQTVHEWLRRYGGDGGLSGLADRSSRPNSCPHQIPAAVEAAIVAMRRAHPGWGPATILWHLQREDVEPLPGRSSVHRPLLRHGLVEGKQRRRRREDYRRWERDRSMQLWQMDVMGRVHLADGQELKQPAAHPTARGSQDRAPALAPALGPIQIARKLNMAASTRPPRGPVLA